MTITPEQARELLDVATPGPWYAHTDSGHPDETYIYDETGNMCIAVEPAGSDYLEADLTLAAAAPELAHTIAGMTEEWGVDANGDALFPVRDEGHPMGSYFTPDRAEAEGVRDRMAKLNPHNNYLLVRRMVSVAEVIEGE